MKKVNYAVIEGIEDDGVVVIVQDGGIATCHNNGEHLITEYYQDRIDDESLDSEDGFWDTLAEGKMYIKDWTEKQEWDEEVVQDMLEWLYATTEEVEFVKCDLDFDDNEAIKKFITEEE